MSRPRWKIGPHYGDISINAKQLTLPKSDRRPQEAASSPFQTRSCFGALDFLRTHELDHPICYERTLTYWEQACHFMQQAMIDFDLRAHVRGARRHLPPMITEERVLYFMRAGADRGLGYSSRYNEIKCCVKLGFISDVSAEEVSALLLSVETHFGRSILLAWLKSFSFVLPFIGCKHSWSSLLLGHCLLPLSSQFLKLLPSIVVVIYDAASDCSGRTV